MTKNETRIAQAAGLLRQARDLCKAAGAARTVARIRLAITSAEGAARHAAGAPYREARRRPLTRHEQLQGLADRGTDTWEDYRGDK